MGANSSRPAALHRSLHSRVATVALFENCTQRTVKVEWLDYGGKPRTYVTLQPGESYRQASYCSHPWQFAPEEAGAPELVHKDTQVWAR